MDDATTQDEYELSPAGAETAKPRPERTPGLSRLDATSGTVEAVSDDTAGTVTRRSLHGRRIGDHSSRDQLLDPRAGVRPCVPPNADSVVSPRAQFRAEDPLGALETLTELRAKVALLIDEHAVRALRDGRSYGDIARALGVSRQAAHRRYRGAAAPRVVATAQARRLLRVAREEAVRARAPALGSAHLLVAALHCGGDAAKALADAGVTLERARTYASDVTSERAGSERLAVGLRAVLRKAAGTVAARGGRWLDANTLLLAALSDPDEGAYRVLTALAVDPGSVELRCAEISTRAASRARGSDRGAT